MAVAKELLEILVCPESREPVIYFAGEAGSEAGDEEFLLCVASRLKYRVDDGIPVMLVEDAERLSEKDVASLVARHQQQG